MKYLRLLWIALFLTVTTSIAVAQTPAPSPQEKRTEADETFDLNITERHIQEKDFHASTAVEIAPNNGRDVRVQVGVAVRASTIDVTLRNVTGTVRFRGSLQKILNLLQVSTGSTPTREK